MSSPTRPHRSLFAAVSQMCERLVANGLPYVRWTNQFNLLITEERFKDEDMDAARSFFEGWYDAHKFYNEAQSDYPQAAHIQIPQTRGNDPRKEAHEEENGFSETAWWEDGDDGYPPDRND